MRLCPICRCADRPSGQWGWPGKPLVPAHTHTRVGSCPARGAACVSPFRFCWSQTLSASFGIDFLEDAFAECVVLGCPVSVFLLRPVQRHGARRGLVQVSPRMVSLCVLSLVFIELLGPVCLYFHELWKILASFFKCFFLSFSFSFLFRALKSGCQASRLVPPAGSRVFFSLARFSLVFCACVS